MAVVKMRPAAIRRLMESRNGPVVEFVGARAQRVAERQRQLAPRESGHMASRIGARLAKDEHGLLWVIGPFGVWYAWFPEFGTLERAAEPFLRPSLDAAK